MRAYSKIYGLIVAQVQYAKKKFPGQLDIETRLAIVQLYLYYYKLKLTGNGGERLIEVPLNDKVQFKEKKRIVNN